MKKIRINELARELEVKPGVILDLLPEYGVDGKMTHSNSIDEDVALALRARLVGPDGPRNGSAGYTDNDEGYGADQETATAAPLNPEQSLSEQEQAERAPSKGVDALKPVRPPLAPPLRSPVRDASLTSRPIASRVPPAIAIPPTPAPAASAPGIQALTETASRESAPKPVPAAVTPETPSTPAPSAAPGIPAPPAQVAAAAPGQPASPGTPAPGPASAEAAASPEAESRARFQPLRPPVGSAFRAPLAPAGAPGSPASPGAPARPAVTPSRPLAGTPARPIAPVTPRSQAAAPGAVTPAGPRQPLPPEPARPTIGIPSERPARSVTPERPSLPSRPVQQPPTHIVVPGSSQSAPAAAQGAPGQPPQSGVPGSPIPPRMPIAPRPAGPGLTPGAPIAPRPPAQPGSRPQLAGQPAARPVVPPRPDLVQRLKQQQLQPRPATPAPGAPRPPAQATPGRPAPAPGRPIFPGPVRPGQPQFRGPGGPGLPGQPNNRRPGARPMHPTSPLRVEPATPPPTDTRRHQAKPGGRQVKRREDVEGNLRERVSRRTITAPPPPIDREITVSEGITVKELSEKLGVKANLVIKKLVDTKKVFATINQTLDVKLAEELAREFGASTNQVSYEQESTQDIEQAEVEGDMLRRAPVVTIMGHVDHGKTSLLDAIRETNIAAREAGGITQHIGAYRIEKNGRKIVFIDTPGHQAFTRMRARGAKVTDIVILVVSADDGVMPQTLEAIDHARAARVPIIVAINKIDKPDAQPDRVKQQLSDRGLLAEDWGGDVVMVPVSAKARINLDLLLEMVLLVADIQDLKANPIRPAIGTVLEAKLDKGRGPVATVLVRNGSLHAGDFFICGALFGKVRAMFDDRGNPVKDAEPSMPVEVIGFDTLPDVGDSFQAVSDTSKAKQIVIYRESKAREAAMAKGARVATLASLNEQFKEGDLKDLNLIIKADVGGTAEVLSDTLQALSNEKVRVRVLRSGVGAVTEDDVLLASASEALIIGFNVRVERNAQSTAEQQKIEIRTHNIIYELIDEVKLAMTGMLEPVFREAVQGHAEVRDTFRISKVGTIAGCYVSDGLIRRDSQVRIRRDGKTLHTGRIESLKRFKNDASEVKNGYECGISLTGFNDIHVGDIIEAFTMERVAAEMPIAVQ
jgi:translation initiation factor IF-2